MNNSDFPNRVESIDKFVSVTRNTLLLLGGIALALYLLPALEGMRQRLKSGSIDELSFAGMLSIKLSDQKVAAFGGDSISVSTIGPHGESIEKGGAELLGETKRRLESGSSSRIDAVLLVPGKDYWGEMLQRYVSTLNAPFVVFQSPTVEGWMHSSGFSAQLDPGKRYRYEELRDLAGMSRLIVKKSDSARSVLERMEAMRTDNAAVVDENGKFSFMISREDILSKVVTSLVLKK